MNYFIFVSALINGIVALAVGSTVYLRKKSHLINQTFAIFCFAIAFWAFGSFWSITTSSEQLSLFSFRILHVGAFFLAVANFHFVCAILGIAQKQKRIILTGYIISVLLLPFISTKFFIEGVSPQNEFALWINPGFLYHTWIVIWLAYFALAFHSLGVFYKKSKGVKKQQIKYIYLGEVVSFAILTMNFLPAYNISVPIYFNILLTGQIIAFGYAILRFRYLNVQLSLLGIAKKSFALIISLGLGLGASYAVFFREEQASVLLLFPIISLATYFSLSGFFNSRSFYRMLGMKHVDDLTKAVDNLYKKRLFYSSLPELLKAIRITFIKELGISTVKIVVLNKNNHKLFATIINYFQKSNDDYLSLREFFPEGKEVEFDRINKLGVFCFPLRGKNEKVVGFFFLGHKPRQNTYTHQELQILKAAAAHISLSLKILNYSADLRRDVAHKTKQLKKQAKKLHLSYRKLKGLDAEKDTFFSMTSHDLRTPLTIIQGYDDFLLSEKFGKLNNKQKDFLSRIQQNTKSMLWLVNSILDISKLEANRTEFNFIKTDLVKIVEEIVEDFQVQCAKKSIQLVFENPQELKLQIETDIKRLQRVLTNLLGNAFKFTPEKGKIILQIRCDKPNFVRFQITDTGMGIPQESRKMIFEKFRQAKNSRGKGGTGLGLSIVKKIVEKLGGKVWVDSKTNQGSSFIFTTPLKPNSQKTK